MTTFLRLLAASIALLPLLSYGAAFPYITLNKQTNRFSDNGISLTYNGIPLGGGSTNALTMSGTPAIGDLPIALDTSGTAGAWSGLLNIARIALPTPNAPTVTVHGTPGSTTYGYLVAWINLVGASELSAETQVANGPATLNGSNYLIINPGACPTNAIGYLVYRMTGPSTYPTDPTFLTGFLNTLGVCGSPVNDIGIAADDSASALNDQSLGVASTNRFTINVSVPTANQPNVYIGTPAYAFSHDIYENTIKAANVAIAMRAPTNSPFFFGNSITMEGPSIPTLEVGGYFDGNTSDQHSSSLDSAVGFSGVGVLPELTAFTATLDTWAGFTNVVTFAKGFSMVDPFDGGYSNPTILTSLASFYARDIGTATDANYGYYSAVNAATNKWAFYGAGTAESYFGGGISAPTFNGYVPLKMSGTPMIGDIATAYSTNGTSGVWSGPVVTTNLVAYISSYCCDAFGNIVRPTDTNAAFAAYQIALQGGYTSPESNPVAGTNSAWSIQLGADGNRGGAWDATESTGYFDVNAASVRTFFANYASTNALPKKNPLFMFIGNHGNGHPVPLGEPIFGINNDFSDNPIFSVIAELVWPAGQGRIGINTNNPAAVLHVSGYSTTVDYQHWTDADGTLAASVTSNKVVRAAGGFSSLGVGTVTTSATGATNTLTANIVLYVTAATGASLTDNAGTTEFSGVTIAAFTPVRLQPGGKFVGTAISYATGTASHAW